jgi:hypothetical protein
MLTETDCKRLSEIRMHLEKFRALGANVEIWEATMFLRIIEDQRREIVRLKRENLNER